MLSKQKPVRDKDVSSPNSVQDHVRNTLEKVREAQGAVGDKQLYYFLTATALVNVGDGKNRFLVVDSLAHNTSRKGFKAGQQYDVGETLASFQKELDFLTRNAQTGVFYCRTSQRF